MFSFFKKKKQEKEEPKKTRNRSSTRKTKENSSISFEIDSELKVTVHCRINPSTVDLLIEKGYLDKSQKEDTAAIKLALILMANEVSDQIILNVNDGPI